MNKLYQLPLYKKFHWYIADILMLAIVCISVAVGGIKCSHHIIFFILERHFLCG